MEKARLGRRAGAWLAVSCFWFGCAAPAAPPTGAVHGPPARYGLGQPASLEAIAAWDRDVRPDGQGLPEGRGTAVEGRVIYAAQCRSCHGEAGRDGPFDRLVGRTADDEFPFGLDPSVPRTIGNYWPWATTVFDYTRRAMPLDRPGSMSDDEVYAVTAYLLFLNGLLGEDEVLDRGSLPGIAMPARGRFFEDDRRGGPEVK